MAEADLEALESMYASDDEKSNKKKKGKKAKNAAKSSNEKADTQQVEKLDDDGETHATDAAANDDDAAADVPRMMTAAEKRKEKKVRDAQKKKEQNAKKPQAAQPAVIEVPLKEESSATVTAVDTKQNGDRQETAVHENSNGDVEEETAEDKEDAKMEGLTAAQKKKLKKKLKEQEKKGVTTAKKEKEPVADEGKPRKGIAKLILQQQQQQREEQERLEREELEAERKLEEARLAREEQARLERERKDRRKLKEKERKQRLKDEGKLLTAKQKQDRRRAEQMLAERGLVPTADGAAPDEEAAAVPGEKKKRPMYKKLKRPKAAAAASGTADDAAVAALAGQLPALSVSAEEQQDVTEADWDALADNWEDVDNAEIELVEEESDSGDDDDDDDDDEDEDDDDNSEKDAELQEEAAPAAAIAVVAEKQPLVPRSGSSEKEKKREKEEDVDPMQRARDRMEARHLEAEADRRTNNLRAPIVCVLGHVDTGKTSILDKLRRTHVQDGEAGGITQQIGATNVPIDSIRNATRMVKSFQQMESLLPGLLIIDTPGHESFANLRSRGSSLCDIAILVVDIMHGIENQTAESIGLLKKRKTPFVIALNKIDRLYEWRTNPHADVANILKKQSTITQNEFQQRVQALVADFAMHELNVALFNENRNTREYVSMVPTSAHSGDGMGNLLAHVCELSQKLLAKRLSYSEELEAAVMEVKEITGLGTTIDVVLVNGRLREGDQVVLSGQEGPIVTQVRALLMPQPMKELRVKNAYEKFKEIKAAQGVKISAKDLEKALAGLPIYVPHDNFELEIYKEKVAGQLKKALKSIQVGDFGVYVQASTLGSLEALLEFLRTEKIPYCGINIGPVHKRDVMKASVMVERDPQWAVILAFDVKVEREAQEMADTWKPSRIRIFTADIIYHLKDAFLQHREDLKKANRDKLKDVVVFPCKLRVMPQHIFNSRDPIVCGVMVEAGQLRLGTPLAVPSKEGLYLGRVTSMEANHKPSERARKGEEVCIKIEGPPGEAPKMYGRHFDHTDLLVSRITRDSIDAVKDHFREEMEKEDWKLVMELKKIFMVI